MFRLGFPRIRLALKSSFEKMDFAKKQLEKYGWKEGEGLGKNRTGISKALKPKLKFDKGGLGHDLFEDIHNTWWQRVYDEAANNIVTRVENGSVVLETVDESVEITKKKKKKRKTPSAYKDFVKTSELRNCIESRIAEEEEEPEMTKKKKMTSGICELTDDELFRVCGGRTAHKGARHGVNMNAKLARIQEQEFSLTQKLSPEHSEERAHFKKKKKKTKD